MTKREQYDLVFYKRNILGDIVYSCQPKINNSGSYANLIFIGRLDISEINNFIKTIEEIQNGLQYDPNFIFTTGTEDMDIGLNNPNFILDNYLTIHMDDLKLLLQEWSAFRNS